MHVHTMICSKVMHINRNEFFSNFHKVGLVNKIHMNKYFFLPLEILIMKISYLS